MTFLGASAMAVNLPEGPADLIFVNGKISTVDFKNSTVEAVAIKDGRFLRVGLTSDMESVKGPGTKTVDLKGRRAIPGLNDSHIHVIRGGLNYNLELRWEDVTSLKEGLRLLREQAKRTPKGQWVRVVGGWCQHQFAEHRLPTLEELNAAAPDTPVFVLHLYDRAMLNRAGLKAVGYTKDTPQPIGGEIQRDKDGNPTGLLIARPNAMILYSTLAKGPKLPREQQFNSTRQFMRDLNRLGVTSIIDAGGGFQRYPDDYDVVDQLHKEGKLTLRIAYNLFPQVPKKELADFENWAKTLKPGQGDDSYRLNGAGEMLVYSAADFEDFQEPRPEMVPVMEKELKEVVSFLVKKRWPFRLHATYGESISRFLNVFEDVNRETPFNGLRWFFDHAETISDKDIARVKALGGGIAVQHRMAYQGEYFGERYGKDAAAHAPPIRKIMDAGVPIGAGTDATRVAGFNPWVSLSWLVTGKTVGGMLLYGEDNRLTREEALRLWSSGSAWFSSEEGKKGAIEPGQLADLAVLSADYFSVPDAKIRNLHSVMTIMGGKVVYGEGDFASLAPKAEPVTPEWSPVVLQRAEEASKKSAKK